MPPGAGVPGGTQAPLDAAADAAGTAEDVQVRDLNCCVVFCMILRNTRPPQPSAYLPTHGAVLTNVIRSARVACLGSHCRGRFRKYSCASVCGILPDKLFFACLCSRVSSASFCVICHIFVSGAGGFHVNLLENVHQCGAEYTFNSETVDPVAWVAAKIAPWSTGGVRADAPGEGAPARGRAGCARGYRIPRRRA